MVAAALVLGLPSCEPETQPDGNKTEKPGKDDDKDDNKDDGKDDSGKDDGGTDKPTPPEPEETVIYYDNLDKVKSTGNNYYFNTWTDCRNMEGTGISDVSYDGFYTSVRSTWSSTGYPGASGVNGVYYSQADGKAYIQVRNIALPSSVRTYKLSVGLHNPNGDVVSGQTFSIGIADEEALSTDWRELPFNVTKYGKWSYATAVFEITSLETEHISIQIKSLVAPGRSDDLRLVTTTETPEHGFGFIHKTPTPEAKDYIERPKTLLANTDYKYVDHRGTTYTSKQEVRNYEACYDIRRHNPMWVAYPCHEIYWEGGYTRPEKDPWRPDPAFEESEQSIIYASDWDGWPWASNGGKPTDVYQYWSPMPTTSTVTKGHLMRSAERGCGDSSNLLDLNVQTFYPTNIAPESYVNIAARTVTVNGKEKKETESHWDKVEYILSSKWRCSDTLYVVVGCVYENEDWVLYDACNWGTKTSKSKPCMVPTARYKLVMRTKSGLTGKSIWECSADEVMAIGFWFPQNFTGVQLEWGTLPPLADYIYSVSDIEKKIGGEFSFFPLAPEGVKDSYSISDWPGLSDIAGSSTQPSYSGVTTEEFNPGGKVSW